MVKLARNFRFTPVKVVPVLILFGVLGALLLIRSFAAGAGVVPFEAENTQPQGNATLGLDTQASSGGYIEFGATDQPPPAPLPPPPTPGTIVGVPNRVPSGTLASAPGGMYGTVNCSTLEPVCAFASQNGDMYIGDPNGQNCGCVMLKNVQTNAIIKQIDVTQLAGAPPNANRPLAIFNPDDNQWLVVYNGWSNGSRLFGARIDAQGNFLGNTIALSNAPDNGWVPKGVYDTVNKKYFVQWHYLLPFMDSKIRKDMLASVVDRNGTVTEMDFNLNNTPRTLDEYGSVAFNSDTGEILSVHSASAVDEMTDNFTRYIDAYRLKLNAAGKITMLGTQRVDSDDLVEWGISLDYNPIAKAYMLVYRKGTTAREGGGITEVYARVLDANGAPKTAPRKLGDQGGNYWVTNTACSKTTNLCVGIYDSNDTYLDANSSGTLAGGPVGPSGVGTFGHPSHKVSYVPTLDTFVIYGGNGYMLAPVR